MAEHEASCQCGGLVARASRDPELVMVCNCTECQRRTGAPFGAGGYFRKAAVEVSGDNRTWRRKGASGQSMTLHFCPTCGTTLYWTLDVFPELMGVAYGCFDTPLPEPSRVVWTSRKHDWVSFPETWQQSETQGGGG